MRPLVRTLIVLAAALVVAEVGVRASGVVDFPLYELDDSVGYLYRAGQSGAFLNRNTWTFNERGMPTARPWQPGEQPDLLLIGNSIVAGGNPYDQREKLGSLIERSLADRYAVWPIAVGGWSTVNAIAYLERHRDVIAATDFFILTHLAHSLRNENAWLGEEFHPRRHPRWATGHVVQRYLRPRLAPYLPTVWRTAAAAPPPDDYPRHLVRFERVVGDLARASGRRHPGILVFYPTLGQLMQARAGHEWLPERADLEAIAARHGLLVLDLTREPEWTATRYRDNIHPTVAGNAVLARLLLNGIGRAHEE